LPSNLVTLSRRNSYYCNVAICWLYRDFT